MHKRVRSFLYYFSWCSWTILDLNQKPRRLLRNLDKNGIVRPRKVSQGLGNCKHIILNVYVLLVCILVYLKTSRREKCFLENYKFLYIIFQLKVNFVIQKKLELYIDEFLAVNRNKKLSCTPNLLKRLSREDDSLLVVGELIKLGSQRLILSMPAHIHFLI